MRKRTTLPWVAAAAFGLTVSLAHAQTAPAPQR